MILSRPVRDEEFRKAWSARHDFCQACGLHVSAMPFPGVSSHHIVKAGRSDEGTNLSTPVRPVSLPCRIANGKGGRQAPADVRVEDMLHAEDAARAGGIRLPPAGHPGQTADPGLAAGAAGDRVAVPPEPAVGSEPLRVGDLRAALGIIAGRRDPDVTVPHDGRRDCRTAFPAMRPLWCSPCLASEALEVMAEGME
jgi:hypothetical protein